MLRRSWLKSVAAGAAALLGWGVERKAPGEVQERPTSVEPPKHCSLYGGSVWPPLPRVRISATGDGLPPRLVGTSWVYPVTVEFEDGSRLEFQGLVEFDPNPPYTYFEVRSFEGPHDER